MVQPCQDGVLLLIAPREATPNQRHVVEPQPVDRVPKLIHQPPVHSPSAALLWVAHNVEISIQDPRQAHAVSKLHNCLKESCFVCVFLQPSARERTCADIMNSSFWMLVTRSISDFQANNMPPRVPSAGRKSKPSKAGPRVSRTTVSFTSANLDS